MHIAFFNRSFYPDTGATGQLLAELCEDLVQKFGCRVSVVAGPAQAKSLYRERYKGIEIYRAWGTRFSKRTFLGRFSNYITYFLSSCILGLRIDRPDVVVALTDPPIIGLAAYLASRRFKVPLVISYRDIFPEVGRLLEDFRSPIVDGILQRVNRFLVKRAGRVIALGEVMRRKLIEGKGADPAKTVVIPDWADCREIVPGPKENPFSRAHGLMDKFVVMHSGNTGLSQGLEVLVRAAQRLSAYPDIQVVFVGDGVKRSSLEQQVKDLELDNVQFLPHQPRENLRDSFASADCFVVSLKRGLAGYIVPSKLYGILAAGRPYVAAIEAESEVAAVTRAYGCGLLANPEDPEDLAQKLLTLYRDRSLARRLGENARTAALTFDRQQGVKAYFTLLRELVEMSDAQAILLACLSSERDPSGLERLARDSKTDWGALYRLAQRHGMVGILAPRFFRIFDGNPPEGFLAPWKEGWQSAALQDLRQLAALEEVIKRASQEGIQPLILKGMALHLQAYPSEKTARGSNDIDLLVRPDEVLRMKRCLEELDFSFRGTDSWSQPVSNWEKFVERDCEALLCRPHPPAAIDLHWRLCAPRLERSCGLALSDRMWERSRTISIGTIRVLIPGREEEVLFLCLHLFKGGTLTLRNLWDLTQLLQAEPPMDWKLLLQIGGESGTLGCAYYAFGLVEELNPGTIPGWVRSSLPQAAGPIWILSPFLKIERLLRTQGESLTDLSTFWNGVLFAQHPWRWFPYQAGRMARWLTRRVQNRCTVFMDHSLVRFIGWRATVLYGDPCHYDRWGWLKKRLLPGPLRTLDAGCGSGALAFYASKIGNEAVGISFDERNNEKARTRARILRLSNIQFFRIDLRELEKWRSQLGQFDQIVCFEVIEHIQQDRKLLSDLASLLKPKGRFLLTTPFKSHRPLFGEKLSETEDGGHVRWGYTHEEIRALFGSCGLDVAREDFVSGLISQKLTSLMGRISRLDPRVAWVVTLPLRILQILDRPLTRLLGHPPLCIGVVGIKRV